MAEIGDKFWGRVYFSKRFSGEDIRKIDELNEWLENNSTGSNDDCYIFRNKNGTYCTVASAPVVDGSKGIVNVAGVKHFRAIVNPSRKDIPENLMAAIRNLGYEERRENYKFVLMSGLENVL
jgi:hypothetical protein